MRQTLLAGYLTSPVQRPAHTNIRLAAPWVVAIITVTTNCCGATAFPKQEKEDITQKEFAKPSGDFVKDFQGSKREFIKEFGFDADKSHDTATPEEIIAEKREWQKPNLSGSCKPQSCRNRSI